MRSGTIEIGRDSSLIAAGGLTPEQVEPWLQAGVDAVALGSSVASRAGVALRLGLDPLRHLLSARSH